MELGVIQGRILKSPLGHQTTHKEWRKEFEIAKRIGIKHIEWNVDFLKNESNPIFHEDINPYLDNISSVCFDTAVTESIFNADYFNEKIINPSKIIMDKGVKSITIPMLEKSEINTQEKLNLFLHNVNRLKKIIPQVNVNLEMDCSIEFTKKILKEVECYLTYDTGNITYKKIDHFLYIDNFFDKINNVHLKDRCSITGESRSDFKGDTPFNSIIKNLSNRNYKNLYTLQMARSHLPDEELIKKYIKIFRRIYEKFV